MRDVYDKTGLTANEQYNQKYTKKNPEQTKSRPYSFL